MRNEKPVVILIVIGLMFTASTIAGFEVQPTEAMCEPQQLGPVQAIASGSSLYLLWEQDTSNFNGTGNHIIYFKKSRDGGKTFDDTVVLNILPSLCSTGAQMVVGRNPNTGTDNIYVLWSNNYKILFKASSDGGATFGNTTILGNGFLGDGGTASFLGFNADVVADSNNGVYVVWIAGEQTSRYEEMFFTKSIDGGKRFSNLTKFASSTADYQDAHVAADGQNVYLVWSEDTDCENEVQMNNCQTKIMFAKSSDRGVSFGNPKVLATGNSTNNANNNDNSSCFSSICGLPIRPEIASLGTIYITWLYGGNSLYLVHSEDGGKTFSTPVNVSEGLPIGEREFYLEPQIIIKGSNTVYIAWSYGTESGNGAYLLKSTDGGNHFQRIVSSIPASFEPFDYLSQELAIAKGQLYFAWLPNPPSHTILFEALQENQSAATVSPSVIYSTSSSSSSRPIESSPILAASGSGNVYVIWTNDTQGIFLRASADDGKSFGSITKVQDVQAVPEFALVGLVILAAASTIVISLGITARRRLYHG